MIARTRLLRSPNALVAKLGKTTFRGLPDHQMKALSFNAMTATKRMVSFDKKNGLDYEMDLTKAADHIGRQQNHIWTKEEIDHYMGNIYRHEPVTYSDRIMNSLVRILYDAINSNALI